MMPTVMAMVSMFMRHMPVTGVLTRVVNYNHVFKNSFVDCAQYGKANNITGGPNGTEQAGTDPTAYMVGALKRLWLMDF